MTHKEFVKNLMSKNSIKVLDFDELLKFALDEHEDVVVCCEKINGVPRYYANVCVATLFDVDRAFGLDISRDDNDDYINLYINWYTEAPNMEMYIDYCNNTVDDECLLPSRKPC